MELHNLTPKQGRRHRRIGRSGKRGSYSGRGVKGQKSRSGRRLRPAERDLILRLPKLRGFANHPKSDKAIAFNLRDLATKLESHAKGNKSFELTIDIMKVAGMIRAGYSGDVKVLGTGEITFPITITADKGIRVSRSAKLKIEKAGGKI